MIPYEFLSLLTGIAVIVLFARLMSAYSTKMSCIGGGKRDRTADPLLARQVLSQLSYTPITYGENSHILKSNYLVGN